MKLKALLLATAITTAIPVGQAFAGDKPYLQVSPQLSSSWIYQVSDRPKRNTWGVGQKRYKRQEHSTYRHGSRQQTSQHYRLPRKKQHNVKQRRQRIWKATGIFAGLSVNAHPQQAQPRRGSVQFVTRKQSPQKRQWILQQNARQNPFQRAHKPRIDSPSRVAHAPRYDNNAARAYIANETARRGVDPDFLPATVDYYSDHKKGTIIIETNTRYLYLILGDGKARRFGVGVGKEGFEWRGTEKISRKAEWPSWRPPAEMIAREREKGRDLPVFMEGGPANPLGARALYLGSTLYRIHGTNQPWSIGQAVSSGCIRMRNEDVIELYESVPVGAKVIVS